MKKALIISLMSLAVSSAMAAPVILTYQTAGTPPALYTDASFTSALGVGSYAELIIRQDSSYSHAEFDNWTVVGTLLQGSGVAADYNKNKVVVGTTALGATTMGVGKIGLKFYNTSYGTDYYVGLRFYNNADKSKATAYGVMDLYKLTKTGDTIGAATTETKNYVTSANPTVNRFYTQYTLAVPEPTTMTLFGLGGLALIIRRKLRKDA